MVVTDLGLLRRRPGRENPRSGLPEFPEGGLFLLDAHDLGALYAENARIDTTTGWPDQLGANTPLGGVVAGPRYRGSLLAGGPCVEFDIDSIIIWSVNLMSGLTAAEYMALQRNTENSGAARGYSYFNNSNFPGLLTWTDGLIYEPFGVTARVTAGNPVTDLTSPYVYNIAFEQGGNYTVKVGAETLYDAACGSLGSFVVTSPRVGENQGSTQKWRGEIGAIAMWPRRLSENERLAARLYFQGLWGI